MTTEELKEFVLRASLAKKRRWIFFGNDPKANAKLHIAREFSGNKKAIPFCAPYLRWVTLAPKEHSVGKMHQLPLYFYEDMSRKLVEMKEMEAKVKDPKNKEIVNKLFLRVEDFTQEFHDRFEYLFDDKILGNQNAKYIIFPRNICAKCKKLYREKRANSRGGLSRERASLSTTSPIQPDQPSL